MNRDSVDEFFEFDAKFACLDHEFFNLAAQQLGAFGFGGFRGFGDDGANSSAVFQQAFSQQLRDDLVRGVGIDFEFFAERADGGERVAGSHLARDHGLLGGVDHLLKERDARPELDTEGDHKGVLDKIVHLARRGVNS